MFKVKCANPDCNQAFSYTSDKESGGINDKGYVTIKCEKCGTVFIIPVINPNSVSNIKGANIEKKGYVHNNEEWLSLLNDMPEILFAPNGLPQNNSVPVFLPFDYSLWKKEKYDFELEAAFFYLINHNAYTSKIQKSIHFYLKSRINPHQIFIVHHYKIGAYKAKMVWAKTINTEKDLNSDKIYLVHHDRVDLEKRIDGLYRRNEAKIILERLLMRWKYLSNQVIIATPFIGFNYKSSIPKVVSLWEWLDSIVDCSKLKFITRKSTYELLKVSQNTTVYSSSFRKEWKIFDRIVEESERTLEAKANKDKSYDYDNAPVSFVEKFHAKFYAGVFDDYVELLIGSYNIHTGDYWENLSFKRYTKEEFMNLYMKKLCPNFKYNEVTHNRVLLLECNRIGEEKIHMAEFNDITKEL